MSVCATICYTSGVVHVLTVEGHDVVEHPLGLNGGAVGVELDGLDVAVDGLVPLALLAVFVTFPVVLLCGHSFNCSGLTRTISNIFIFVRVCSRKSAAKNYL